MMHTCHLFLLLVMLVSCDKGSVNISSRRDQTDPTAELASPESEESPSLEGDLSLELPASSVGVLGEADISINDSNSDPSEIILTVTTLPSKGLLVDKGSKVEIGHSFSVADLENGRIKYVGTDPGALADSFLFKISDEAGNEASEASSASPATFNLNFSGALDGCDGLDTTTDAFDANGSGTPADPYVICTEGQLRHLANNCGNGFTAGCSSNYKLGRNIVMSPSDFAIIGNGTYFWGVFDGNNHAIVNMQITGAGNDVGMFGIVGNGAEIKNLFLIDINVSAAGYDHVGALVGSCQAAAVSNISASGNVLGRNRVGGIIGYSYQTNLQDSSLLSLDVEGDLFCGGAIGYADGTGVHDLEIFTGVTCNGDHAGGLAGLLTASISGVSDITFRGNVNSSGAKVGGAFGELNNTSNVSGISIQSGSNQSVLGVTDVGGVVGYLSANASIIKSMAGASLTVSGDQYVGGFAGGVQTSSILNSYSLATVVGDDSVGGFAGEFNDGGESEEINYSFSAGSVAGNTNVGGFVGVANNPSRFVECFWDNQTSTQATGHFESVGSLEGKSSDQLQSPATFASTNWDFSTIWQQSSEGYPNLR